MLPLYVSPMGLVRRAATAVVALLAITTSGAPAADLYWSGTGTWDTTATNWGSTQGGPYNDATWSNATPDSAVFEGSAGTVTLGEAITAAGLTFAVDGYTVTADTLTLSGTPTIAANTGVSATIASVLAGSDAITKTGAGTLTLSAANTYSGGTTVSEGVIVVGNAAAFGTGAITLAGGSLRPTPNLTLANAIVATASTTSDLMNAGTGDFIFTGSGSGSGTLVANSTVSRSMWLQGDWSGFTGQLQFTVNNNGTNYRLGGTGRTSSETTTAANFSGAAFVLGGSTTANRNLSWNGLQGATVQLGALSGSGGRIDIALGTNRVATWEIGALNTDTSFSGVFAGTGTAVTKVGTGTLTLSGVNSHTGGTRLEAGILAAGNNAAFGTGTLTLAGGTIRPTATRVIGNAISVANGTTSGLIDGGSGDLMYTGAATGDGNLAANSTNSRSMWLQGDWSGFSGQIEFTVNGGGTNYRLGGAPGSTTFNNGTNSSDFSQATFVLSGTGADRGLSWNGAAGATVQVGTLSGAGGRIISGAGGRDANWEVGGLNADSSTAVVITGPATSLTKVGTGTLTLTGTSTYSGGTIVNAGTLDLDATSAIGTGSLTIADGASVNALRAFAISTDGAAAGRVVNVAGSLSMVDTEYVQTYNLTAGTIAAPASGGGYLRAPTAGFSINSLAAATSSLITGRIDLTFSSGTVDVADGAAADDLVISANILQNTGAGSGAKSITKTGAGTLLLSGTNSYTGGTFVNAGLVKAGSSRALGAENAAASTVTIAAGATLDINRVTGNTGDFFYGMTIAGGGTAGQGALINTGANGSTNLRQTPNITLSADATIGGSGNILMLNASYGPNSLNLAGNTLTKTGTNSLVLVNTTVSAGTIDIQQGSISQSSAGANASAAAITLADTAGASLNLNNLGLQVGSLAGGGATGGNVTLGSATLTLGGRNEDTSFGGAISGTGAVVKTGTGTQTFAAANTYSGGTTISGGTLLAGVADAFGTTGTLTVEAGGTLGVGAGVNFTRAFTLNTGGKVWLGDNATIALPDAAALAAWESSNTAGGDGTVADILYGSGATTPSALTSAWTANPGGYFSDILTLEGTGTGNTYVLSMTYNPTASGSLNVWYRENPSDPFAPLGTSFQGDTPWNSGFTTVGQYGLDSSTNTVWVVTDHNSQFVVVPEPGTLGLAAVCLAGGIWYLRGRLATRWP
jgi:fibronectin-binding autotransporter adhesin